GLTGLVEQDAQQRRGIQHELLLHERAASTLSISAASSLRSPINSSTRSRPGGMCFLSSLRAWASAWDRETIPMAPDGSTFTTTIEPSDRPRLRRTAAGISIRPDFSRRAA